MVSPETLCRTGYHSLFLILGGSSVGSSVPVLSCQVCEFHSCLVCPVLPLLFCTHLFLLVSDPDFPRDWFHPCSPPSCRDFLVFLFLSFCLSSLRVFWEEICCPLCERINLNFVQRFFSSEWTDIKSAESQYYPVQQTGQDRSGDKKKLRLWACLCEQEYAPVFPHTLCIYGGKLRCHGRARSAANSAAASADWPFIRWSANESRL